MDRKPWKHHIFYWIHPKDYLADCDCHHWFIYIFQYVSLWLESNLKNQTNIYPTERSNSKQIDIQLELKTLTKILQVKWTLPQRFYKTLWKVLKNDRHFESVESVNINFVTENKILDKQQQRMKLTFLELYYSSNSCFEYKKYSSNKSTLISVFFQLSHYSNSPSVIINISAISFVDHKCYFTFP